MPFSKRNASAKTTGKTTRGKRARRKGAAKTPQQGRRRTAAGKALTLGLVLASCTVCVLLLASPISYVPLTALLVALAASFAYLQILKRGFSFSEQQMIDSCERGHEVGMRVVLSNRTPLPFPRIDMAFFITDLFGAYDASRSMTVNLGPRETRSYDFDASFSHLGRYEAGVESIVIHDLLGLFTARIENTRRRSVVVRPRVFDFHQADISEAGEEESANPVKTVTDDSADYASVREYHYGDPLKTIHWNLSARSIDGTLYTRLFELNVSPTLRIVMDPFSAAQGSEVLMELFDAIVEATASLSRTALGSGIECSIAYLDRKLEPATTKLLSDADADELVLDLKRIECVEQAQDRADLPIEMLRSEGCGPGASSNIAFATSRIDARISTALTDIAARHRNPILLLAVPASLAGHEREEFLAPARHLSLMGIPCIVVESDEHETRVAR